MISFNVKRRKNKENKPLLSQKKKEERLKQRKNLDLLNKVNSH